MTTSTLIIVIVLMCSLIFICVAYMVNINYINYLKNIRRERLKFKNLKDVEQYIIDDIKTYYIGTIDCPTQLGDKTFSIGLREKGLFINYIASRQEEKDIWDNTLYCCKYCYRLINIYYYENVNEQLDLLKSFIKGKDKYDKDDYAKNNFINMSYDLEQTDDIDDIKLEGKL